MEQRVCPKRTSRNRAGTGGGWAEMWVGIDPFTVLVGKEDGRGTGSRICKLVKNAWIRGGKIKRRT